MFHATVSQITEIRDDLKRYVSILDSELKARTPLVDTSSGSKMLNIEALHKTYPSEYYYFAYKDKSICISYGKWFFSTVYQKKIKGTENTYHINCFGFVPEKTFPGSIFNRSTCHISYYNYGSFANFEDVLLYFGKCISELLDIELVHYNELL